MTDPLNRSAHLPAPQEVLPEGQWRHRDSRWVWIGVIAGSVGLHGLLLWAAQDWTVRLQAEATGDRPIPVTLVQPPAESASEPVAIAPSSPPSDLAPTPQPEVSPPPSSEPVAPSTTPAPVLRPAPDTPAETEPTAEPEAEDPPVPSPPPSSPPEPSPPDPSSDSASDDTASPQPAPPPVSGTGAAPPLPSQANGSSDAPPSAPSGAVSDDPTLPGIAVNPDPSPAEFQITMQVAAGPAPDPSAANALPPDRLPQPLETEKRFVADPVRSPCTVTPAIDSGLGTPVLLQVSLDASGAVTQSQVWSTDVEGRPLAPSGAAADADESGESPESAYEQFAACLVDEWGFSPAMQGGQPVASDRLFVTVTITAL